LHDIPRISGPISFTVHEGVQGQRQFYVFGDEHDSKEGVCPPDTQLLWGTLHDIFASVAGQNDLYVETSDNFIGFEDSWQDIRKKPFTELYGTYDPLMQVGAAAKICMAQGPRCKRVFPKTRFHWVDVRSSNKGKLRWISGHVDEDAIQFPLTIRRAIVEWVLSILRSDALLTHNAEDIVSVGAQNVWEGSAESAMCREGCHRIRKQLRTQTPAFRERFYEFFEQELRSLASDTDVDLLYDIDNILLDMYTIARSFKYRDQKNIFIYVGDWHARRIRRFLKFINPQARMLEYPALSMRCLDTQYYPHVIS
jgi:hypothetical protein